MVFTPQHPARAWYRGAVQRPLFSVPVRDLDSGDQRRHWDVPASWIDWALADSEAQSDGSPGELWAHLKKNGRQVLVKGEVRAQVTMPCARTMDPVPVTLEAPILLLLSPRSTPAKADEGRGRRRARGSGGSRRGERGEESEELLSAELAAQDEYDGETLELDEFVREHLLLELPLFPVRSDLPFEPAPATDTRPGQAQGPEERPLDPRLAPLAVLASQMQRTDEE